MFLTSKVQPSFYIEGRVASSSGFGRRRVYPKIFVKDSLSRIYPLRPRQSSFVLQLMAMTSHGSPKPPEALSKLNSRVGVLAGHPIAIACPPVISRFHCFVLPSQLFSVHWGATLFIEPLSDSKRGIIFTVRYSADVWVKCPPNW